LPASVSIPDHKRHSCDPGEPMLARRPPLIDLPHPGAAPIPCDPSRTPDPGASRPRSAGKELRHLVAGDHADLRGAAVRLELVGRELAREVVMAVEVHLAD